jgi:hypothetical protein
VKNARLIFFAHFFHFVKNEFIYLSLSLLSNAEKMRKDNFNFLLFYFLFFAIRICHFATRNCGQILHMFGGHLRVLLRVLQSPNKTSNSSSIKS